MKSMLLIGLTFITITATHALSPALRKQFDSLLEREITSQDEADELFDFIDKHSKDLTEFETIALGGKLLKSSLERNDDSTTWWYRPPGERGFGLGIILQKKTDQSKPAISHIVPGSSADQSSLRVGDVIEKIQEVDTTHKTVDECIAVIKAAETDNISLQITRSDGVTKGVEIPKAAYWLPAQPLQIEDKPRGITLTLPPSFFSRPSHARKEKRAYYFESKEREQTGIVILEVDVMDVVVGVSGLPWTKQDFPRANRESIAITKMPWSDVSIPLIRQKTDSAKAFYYIATLPTSPNAIRIRGLCLTEFEERARTSFISFLRDIKADHVLK